MSHNAKTIAVVGAGLVGRRHINAIQHVADAQLCAIVDPDPQAKRYASECGVPYYVDLTDLYEAQKPHGVILSTPTLMHVEQGIMCLENGSATLVEKPIANSVEAGQQMVALSERLNLPLLVGHHRRYNPIIETAKEIINQGKLGDIRAVQATCWFYKPDEYFSEAPWRAKKGAGPLSVNLIHDIDLLRYFCGDIIAVQASARPARRGYENEDIAAAILEFDNGALGTISVSDATVAPWSWEMTSGEYPVYSKTEESCYLIGGSKGALSIPDLKTWRHSERPDWWSPIENERQIYAATDPLVNQIQHFIDVMNGRAQPIVSGQEGLNTLKVIEAIQVAAQTNRRIEIETHFNHYRKSE